MVKITVIKKMTVDVKYLRANCGVRYWEDATVDGVIDTDGDLIPCRQGGDDWEVLIDLDTGVIQNWTHGKTAKIHYKVCDDGVYVLLDETLASVVEIDGYVPSIMCPGGSGYGDYVIMSIKEDGQIENWKVDLKAFEKFPDHEF